MTDAWNMRLCIASGLLPSDSIVIEELVQSGFDEETTKIELETQSRLAVHRTRDDN